MYLDTIITNALAIRRDALALLYFAGSGHPGGALSCADIVAYLWEKELQYKNTNWQIDDRNRLILSKGHSIATLYAAAGRSGLIPANLALTLRKLGSPLQGHPCVLATPWVETSTGSLGQGLSVGIGMALGLRHQNIGGRVYVIMGDGEMQEGEVWEGAMSAAHFKLENICVIVDYNKLQSDDLNENIMGIESLIDKWKSFNWAVQDVDGHDMVAIERAIMNTKEIRMQPSVILANTIKGKGVSFMENVPAWHGSVKITPEQFKHALNDLGLDSDQMEAYLNGTFWN
ncbi:MAG: transketolase [Comamonadaceae bacterium]|nr:MAG: transketolase [Comamonadaceae bacterium]